MFNLFRKLHYVNQQQARSAGSGLLFNGIIFVLFSLAIFNDPAIVAYLVAVLLMIVGISMLTAWWKIRKWR